MNHREPIFALVLKGAAFLVAFGAVFYALDLPKEGALQRAVSCLGTGIGMWWASEVIYFLSRIADGVNPKPESKINPARKHRII